MQKNAFKKSLVVLIIILFIGASIVPMIGAFVVNDENKYLSSYPVKNLDRNGWWDHNWSYYKQLNISNPLLDYQMLITVFKENGHDDVQNGIIDCEDNCKEDFSDIRFIDQTHTTLLPYWIEEIGIDKTSEDNGDHYSRIWVKTTGDNTIYMYYGNPDAVSLSNGTSTFVFFEDFDSYTEWQSNPDGWSITTCSFETFCYVSCNTTNAYDGKCLEVYGCDDYSSPPQDEYSVASRTINLSYDTYELRVYMKAGGYNENFYGYVRRDGSILITKNKWNTWSLGTARFISSITNLELVARYNGLDNGIITVYYDNLLIRKCNSTEPYWADFSDQCNGKNPYPPRIDGPTSGNIKIAYQWNFTSIDPNNDNIFYQIDWGDGDVSIWYGPYDSGETMPQSHEYEHRGKYNIRAKAKDIYGAESAWALLKVKMPRTYTQLITRLFGRFPYAFPILRHLIRLN